MINGIKYLDTRRDEHRSEGVMEITLSEGAQEQQRRWVIINSRTKSSGDSYGVPPVPIPNTVVKPIYAESTWLEATWEDK